MKKINTTLSIALIFLFSISYSQRENTINETKYQSVEDFKYESEIIHISEMKNKGTICVKEHLIKLSDKAHYSFFHYDSNHQLINKQELKTKRIDRVFFTNDTIHLVKVKKNGSPVKSIDYYTQSSSIKDFNFTEKKWFSINDLNSSWNDTNGYFYTDKSKKGISHIFNYHSTSSKNKPNNTDVKIITNDELKKNYNSGFYINLFDSNMKKTFTKKVIISNDIGKFRLDKTLIDYDNQSVYLLLSTKKKRLISYDKKLNTKYHVVQISPEGNKLYSIKDIQHPISIANMEIYEDKLVLAGLYSETNDFDTHGFFKLNLNKKTMLGDSINYIKFNSTILKDIKRKNKKDYIKCEILFSNYMSFDENGDCIINIENSAINTNNGHSTRIQKSIIAAKINKNNEIVWSRAIKGKDRSHLFLKGSNLFYISKSFNGVNYIIRNDTPISHRTYNRSDEKMLNSYLYLFSIRDNGEIVSKRFSPYNPDINYINIANTYSNSNIYTYMTSDNKYFYLSKFSWE